MPGTAADIVCDLERPPYPLRSDSFDRIVLNNVIEHLNDIVSVMQELHRIARDGAEIIIRTPHFSSLYSWQDPTHKHHLAYDSFDYFSVNAGHIGYYANVKFELLEKRIIFGKSVLSVIPRLLWRLSKHKYEKHFAFVFPANDLLFRLRVIKGSG